LRQKCFLVVADLIEPSSKLSFENLIILLIKRSSGSIFLAGSLYKKLKLPNSLVLPGIIPSIRNNHIEKKKHEITLRQIDKVSNILFPNSNLQEREFNFIYFADKYGMDLIKQIFDELSINKFEHQVITI
jgi:hypothetical protein